MVLRRGDHRSTPSLLCRRTLARKLTLGFDIPALRPWPRCGHYELLHVVHFDCAPLFARENVFLNPFYLSTHGFARWIFVRIR